MNAGYLYGYLALTSWSSLPVFDLESTDVGNHIYPYESDSPKGFDYLFGGNGLDHNKLYVTSRNTTVSGYRAGASQSELQLKRVIQSYLTLNDGETESNAFLPLMATRVFEPLDGRFIITLNISSSQPKIVFMSKNMTLYFLALYEEPNYIIVWSNDPDLEDKLRKKYESRFYYYRLRPLENGIRVIQSRYLRSKFLRWRDLRDNLKLFNALDLYLERKTLSVNREVDHQHNEDHDETKL